MRMVYAKLLSTPKDLLAGSITTVRRAQVYSVTVDPNLAIQPKPSHENWAVTQPELWIQLRAF